MMFKSLKFFLSAVAMMVIACSVSAVSFAEPAEASEQTSTVEVSAEKHSIGQGIGYMAAALAIAVGSLGAGYAVASAAPAALGAFSENPDSFGKIIVFVALGEGVSIFSFVISMMIVTGLK